MFHKDGDATPFKDNGVKDTIVRGIAYYCASRENSLKLECIRRNHKRKQQLRRRRRNRCSRSWDKWQMASKPRGASPPGYYPITILISLSAISFTFQFALRLLSFGCNLSIKVFVRQQKAAARERSSVRRWKTSYRRARINRPE